MVLKIKLRRGTIQKLEASIRGGAQAVSKQLHRVIRDETIKWAKGLIRAIETDSRFTELKSDTDLRGVLGMPRKQFRRGSDTDADDLIGLLNTFKITSNAGLRSKKVSVKFPSVQSLENQLVRSFTTITNKGSVISGATQSWFRWWEFGDQGEITSLTILRRTIGKLKQARGKGQSRSRANLTRLINKKSRSGAALQIANRPADSNSHITGRGLVTEKYKNFAKIFPARVGKKVKQYFINNRARIQRLFVRARTR